MAEHILPVLARKTNQTLEKVVELNIKYGRTRTKKVEEAVEDLLKFPEDHYKDDEKQIMEIKELNQRHKELKMNQEEFYSVWMLGKIKSERRWIIFKFRLLEM